ncbi:hypothetical protein [Natrialba swarupiae]|uniref:Uncharacterized protein n=1 Tax=Natrialba swarupiae TaxID=2448032 RepID=A0A5D5AQK0_9EURY|nr:hypothetical protein [Natrialba swarupiae]TYT63334.1 hypothetical protein FYC77_04490 [Natrialba swarupiae]
MDCSPIVDDSRDGQDDPTDSFDLEYFDRIRVGVTRGEYDLGIGPPREYPARGDVSVRPDAGGDGLVLLSTDAMAGDYGTGHADVALTLEESRTLRDLLDEAVRCVPARSRLSSN